MKPRERMNSLGEMEFWAVRARFNGVSKATVARHTCLSHRSVISRLLFRYLAPRGGRGRRRRMVRAVSYDFRLRLHRHLWMYAWDTNFTLYALNAMAIRRPDAASMPEKTVIVPPIVLPRQRYVYILSFNRLSLIYTIYTRSLRVKYVYRESGFGKFKAQSIWISLDYE